MAEEFVAAEVSHDGAGQAGDGQAPSWYGDTAYGTGELREAIGNARHKAVIKPKPVQPAVPGGFTRDDFTVDDQAGMAGRHLGSAR